MTIVTLGTGGALAMAPHPLGPPADPALQAAEQARGAEALMALSRRLREVAAVVDAQVVVHRGLLDLDWHGSAATLFTDAVSTRASALASLVRAVEQLAADALRRSQQVAGGW